MFQPERKLILAGLAWFIVVLSPALPLFEHFFPYYLFLPMVGVSVAVGVILDGAYRRAARYSSTAAALVLGTLVGLVLAINIVSVKNDVQNNRALGRSATLALNSLNDLKAARPTLQPHTTIYLSNAEEPDLNWDTSQGALFKLAYGDETIETLYWSWGEVITKGILARGPVVVLKYRQSHLEDVTSAFLAESEPPVNYSSITPHRMELDPPEVGTGQNYRLKISGLSNMDVAIHYTMEGGPIRLFTTRLDEGGEARFSTSERTQKGLYRFVGFRLVDSTEWNQTSATIRVY
jgi:hypothetical protein